jgi:anti-sigma B factor antagonist
VRQHDLTSEVSTNQEVDMPDPLVVPGSTAPRADAPPPTFACSWADSGLDAAWVHVAGELDLATAPHLEQTLGQPQLQARLVVLDLRELAFIDSAGVHAMVNATTRARLQGRRLVLLRGPPNVDRVFTLAGSLDDVEIGDVRLLDAPVEPRGEAVLAS